MRIIQPLNDFAFMVFCLVLVILFGALSLGYYWGHAPVTDWSEDFRAVPQDRWLIVQFEADPRFNDGRDYYTVDAFCVGKLWFLTRGQPGEMITPVQARAIRWTHP